MNNQRPKQQRVKAPRPIVIREAVEVQVKPKRKRNKRRRGKGPNAVVALSQNQGLSAAQRLTQTGTDRFIHIPNVKTSASQVILFSDIVTVKSFARLSQLSNTYQRYRIHNIRFRVEPQISTQTSGGYVAGFVTDPSVVVPSGAEGLNFLTSVKGAITKKWWESGVVVTPPMPDDLFCVVDSTQLRWSAAGRFVLGVDGAASVDGALTVYVDWTVELLDPTLSVTTTEEPPSFATKVAQETVSVYYSEGDSNLGYAFCPAGSTPHGIEKAFPEIESLITVEDPNPHFTFSRPVVMPSYNTDNSLKTVMECHRVVLGRTSIFGGDMLVLKMIAYGPTRTSDAVGVDGSTNMGDEKVILYPQGSIFDAGYLEFGDPPEPASVGTQYLCCAK